MMLFTVLTFGITFLAATVAAVPVTEPTKTGTFSSVASAHSQSTSPASIQSSIDLPFYPGECRKPGPVITGFVQNNCPFTIYVIQAWGEDHDPCSNSAGDVPAGDSGLAVVRPGGRFWAPHRAYDDARSMTIKISLDKQFARNIYQIEYSIAHQDRPAWLWYNLSSVNGNPFLKYARYLEIGGSHGNRCPKFYCKPGQDTDGCDWPFHTGDCPASTGGDVKFYLC